MGKKWYADTFAVICAGVAIRAIVSLHPYSGKGKSPMYGDYEAQRHWQEVTLNLPAVDWYKNSSKNNLTFWGLDYPPLTAYHSYLMGEIAYRLNASYVELKTSQGFESSSHKSFMRLSVLASDVLVFIPAILFLAIAVGNHINSLNTETWQILIAVLLYPGQILIDNGHFQYNNVSLGLAAAAITCILTRHHLLSALFFTLSLNYKQMELYHSLPFFIYLLRMCITESFCKFLSNLVKIGAIVTITFTILWLPWIFSMDNIKPVISRIFPLARGVFEDKVSNFWCAANVVIKLKLLLTNQQMAYICMVTTLISTAPIIINVFRKPTKRHFIHSLFNVALCFYLFSYQVHEKSILLVALPAVALYSEQPFLTFWFLQISFYSMFPLLQKDDLTIPFIVMSFMYYIIFDMLNELGLIFNKQSKKLLIIYKFSNCVIFSLISCCLFIPTPAKYPHLYILVLALFTFLHFFVFLFYFVYKQLRL